MGQTEVYGFLEENRGKWLTAKEIANALKQSTSSVYANLKRLKESSPIFFVRKKDPNSLSHTIYKYMVK